MNQCKTLLRKEWNTHRVGFLMPLWFTGGVYVVLLISWIISLVRGQNFLVRMQVTDIPAGWDNFLPYSSGAGVTALLGVVALFTAISLADSLINSGYKRRCEILHFSQPVPFAKIALTKYLFMTVGTILLWGVLSLLNGSVTSLVTSRLTHGQFHYGITGWLQVWLAMSLSLLLLSSLFWFFAGLFKRKSAFLGILSLLAIQATVSILNYTLGWQIPSPLQYLARLSTVYVNLSIAPPTPDIAFLDLNKLIASGWQQLFSWESLLKLLYSAALFLAGSWLYKRRELT